MFWDRRRNYFWTACPFKMGPTGCPETSLTTNQRCLTSQKKEDLDYKPGFDKLVPDLTLTHSSSSGLFREGSPVGLVPSACSVRTAPHVNSYFMLDYLKGMVPHTVQEPKFLINSEI